MSKKRALPVEVICITDSDEEDTPADAKRPSAKAAAAEPAGPSGRQPEDGPSPKRPRPPRVTAPRRSEAPAQPSSKPKVRRSRTAALPLGQARCCAPAKKDVLCVLYAGGRAPAIAAVPVTRPASVRSRPWWQATCQGPDSSTSQQVSRRPRRSGQPSPPKGLARRRTISATAPHSRPTHNQDASAAASRPNTHSSRQYSRCTARSAPCRDVDGGGDRARGGAQRRDG